MSVIDPKGSQKEIEAMAIIRAHKAKIETASCPPVEASNVIAFSTRPKCYGPSAPKTDLPDVTGETYATRLHTHKGYSNQLSNDSISETGD